MAITHRRNKPPGEPGGLSLPPAGAPSYEATAAEEYSSCSKAVSATTLGA